MQYILSEEEMKRGKRLLESWRMDNLTLEQVYEKSDILINQGWHTVIYNPDVENPDRYGIIVYGEAE